MASAPTSVSRLMRGDFKIDPRHRLLTKLDNGITFNQGATVFAVSRGNA